MADWHTVTTARVRWPGAPKNDVVLLELLEVAKYQIEKAAADLAPDELTPITWPMAQIEQARALYAASRAAGDDGEIGLDGYQLRQGADMSARIRRLIGSAATPRVG